MTSSSSDFLQINEGKPKVAEAQSLLPSGKQCSRRLSRTPSCWNRIAMSPLGIILDPPWVSLGWLLELVGALVVGCILGAVAFPFVELVNKFPEWWMAKTGPDGFPDVASSLGFRGGSPYWVLICWLGGTAVGLLKASVGLDAYPSFIHDLKSQHVIPAQSAKVFVCCAASLCAGASLGPEAGLGSLGAMIGHGIAGVMERSRCLRSANAEAADLRRRTFILCGMSSAFGATFPSVYSAIILVGEISSAGTEEFAGAQLMGQRRLSRPVVGLIVPAATCAFCVRFAWAPNAEYHHPGAFLPYSNWNPIIGAFLSIIAAVVGLAFVLMWEGARFTFFWLGTGIEKHCGRKFRILIIASIAGMLNGLLLYLFPTGAGSGIDMMQPTIRNAPDLTADVLAYACLAKCAIFAVSAAGGFVGGMFFPLMYVGLLAGEVCAKVFSLPRNLSVFVMMSAVPGSVVMAPLSMVALPIGMYSMSPLTTIPLFVANILSNKIFLGSGFLHKMLRIRIVDD